jgi:hypothetical protein
MKFKTKNSKFLLNWIAITMSITSNLFEMAYIIRAHLHFENNIFTEMFVLYNNIFRILIQVNF